MVSVQGIFTNILSHIDNQLGLYALAGIFLLILIYLIRPKAMKRTIPSLIFLMKDKGKSKKESFFEKLLRDFLLIFHFFLVAILAISATQPFFLSDKDISKDHTVLVIDTSASIHASSGFGKEIFDGVISKAKSYVDGKTSIVIVDNEPLVALKDGKEEEAIEIISKLKSTNSLSSIGNSILAAGDLLAGEKGRVVVISDFINTDSVEPIIASKTLEAKGVHVEFVDLSENGKSNIGIVDADLSEKETKVIIKNFNEKPVKFDVDINGDKVNIGILPRMDETITFKNKEGDNIVKLLIDDDLKVDNIAHFYTPVKKKVKILFISNEPQSFILPALNAYKLAWNSEVEIETAAPPKMPSIDHDVFILGKVDAGKLPSGSIEQMARLVEKKGASFISVGFDGLHKIKLKKLIPVELKNLKASSTEVFNLQSITDVTQDLSFSKTDAYYAATSKKGATSIANAKDNSTIIAVSDLGSGKIAYYGIFDPQSKFKFDVSYPLFWQQLIDYMISAQSVSTLNYRVGEKLVFDEALQITTPLRKFKAESIEFNEVGVHSIAGREVYVNLLNPTESDINFAIADVIQDGYEAEKGVANVKKRLMPFLIYAALLLLFLELLYIKIRGDL